MHPISVCTQLALGGIHRAFCRRARVGGMSLVSRICGDRRFSQLAPRVRTGTRPAFWDFCTKLSAWLCSTGAVALRVLRTSRQDATAIACAPPLVWAFRGVRVRARAAARSVPRVPSNYCAAGLCSELTPCPSLRTSRCSFSSMMLLAHALLVLVLAHFLIFMALTKRSFSHNTHASISSRFCG